MRREPVILNDEKMRKQILSQVAYYTNNIHINLYKHLYMLYIQHAFLKLYWISPKHKWSLIIKLKLYLQQLPHTHNSFKYTFMNLNCKLYSTHVQNYRDTHTHRTQTLEQNQLISMYKRRLCNSSLNNKICVKSILNLKKKRKKSWKNSESRWLP